VSPTEAQMLQAMRWAHRYSHTAARLPETDPQRGRYAAAARAWAQRARALRRQLHRQHR